MIYLAAGRLLVWTLQNAGLLRWFWSLAPILEELRACDFCMGCWVYFGLIMVMPGPALGIWPTIVERLIIAITTAFLGHLIGIGWRDKFGVTIIE